MKTKKDTFTFIIAFLVMAFNTLIIIYPAEIISAARVGLNLWFNNVLPSLLPFIIGSNILIGLGAVNFFGALLEPIMKPLFGVPGCGGFALVTGMTSGYPMGAKIVATLRENNDITKTEAERLMAFANNSGPLFILGTVGIGMFGSKSIGYYFIVTHYLSAIVVGIIAKFYKLNKKQTKDKKIKRNHIYHAISSMKIARSKDKRTFGGIFGDSVKNAMETVVAIGGFIILFCVIVKMLEITNVISLLSDFIVKINPTLEITKELSNGFLVGIMEITNGSKLISSVGISKQHLLATVAVISFGGFSIHAQATSFLQKTDISAIKYIIGKALHAAVSVIVGSLIYGWFNLENKEAIETLSTYTAKPIERFYFSSISFIGVMFAFIAAAIICTLLYSLLPRISCLFSYICVRVSDKPSSTMRRL